MTLRGLYDRLESVALSIPDIRSVVENDVLRLNEMRDIKYGVFAIQQERHTSNDVQAEFTLDLYCIDRLVNSGENEVGIQSHAIDVLRAILNKIGEDMEVYGISYLPFTYRFQDLCAGAMATATFVIPLSECNEILIEERERKDAEMGIDVDEGEGYVRLVITLPLDATGNCVCRVGGNAYTAIVEEGLAMIEINDLPAGEYNFRMTYEGDANYKPEKQTGTFTIY